MVTMSMGDRDPADVPERKPEPIEVRYCVGKPAIGEARVGQWRNLGPPGSIPPGAAGNRIVGGVVVHYPSVPFPASAIWTRPLTHWKSYAGFTVGPRTIRGVTAVLPSAACFRSVVAASGPGSALRSPGSGRAIVPLDVFVSLSEEMID